MNKNIPLFVFLLLSLQRLQAMEYFVGPVGKDSSPGVDPGAPFLTIQHAVDVAQAGDTITVLDGTYHESVKISHSGTKNAPLTIRAQNHWGAKVISRGEPENCFTIGGADALGVSYIIIQGFDLTAPATYGSGVSSAYKAHHLTIDGVSAHDCGSSGIGLGDGDYRVVRNCVCSHNALLMPYCGSGISLYGLIKADDEPGFHNIVSANICYGNDNGLKTKQTDGNGIIIDDFRDKQEYHTTKPNFDFNQSSATLVEGNLCFSNGGKGIIIYSSNHVSVFNNTCCRDMQRGNQGGDSCGEITISCSSHAKVVNNIAIVANGDRANSAYAFGNTNGKEYPEDTTMQGTITVENNLSFDANKPGAPVFFASGVTLTFAGANGNLAGVDPKLAKPDASELYQTSLPPTTYLTAYFGLSKASPAIGAGTPVDATDPPGSIIDLGAFQLLHFK